MPLHLTVREKNDVKSVDEIMAQQCRGPELSHSSGLPVTRETNASGLWRHVHSNAQTHETHTHTQNLKILNGSAEV